LAPHRSELLFRFTVPGPAPSSSVKSFLRKTMDARVSPRIMEIYANGGSPSRHDGDLRAGDQLRELAPCVEGARFHRGFVDADDLGDVLDRFAMVVGEVDDLAVFRREPPQSVAQPLFAIFLLEDKLRIVRGIDERVRKLAIERNVGAAAARGQRLVAGDRQEPSRNRSTPRKRRCLAPD